MLVAQRGVVEELRVCMSPMKHNDLLADPLPPVSWLEFCKLPGFGAHEQNASLMDTAVSAPN